jgi:hypothetical protein
LHRASRESDWSAAKNAARATDLDADTGFSPQAIAGADKMPIALRQHAAKLAVEHLYPKRTVSQVHMRGDQHQNSLTTITQLN